MPEYSTSTTTDQDSGSADRSGSATAGDAGATDASSRSERSDLSPGSVTSDPSGSDRPSVGAGEQSADGGVGTRDAGEPAADAQGPDSADSGVGIRDGGSDIGEGGMSTPDAASAQGGTGDSDATSPAGSDDNTGAIQPGDEQAGPGGYTGDSGYSGHIDPDVEGQNYPASTVPIMVAIDIATAGGASLFEGAVGLAEIAVEAVEGVVMAETSYVDEREVAKDFADGVSGQEQQGAASAGPQTDQGNPQGGTSVEEGGSTGSTSDGAGYSAEGQAPDHSGGG